MVAEHKVPMYDRGGCGCEAHVRMAAAGYRCEGSGKPPEGLIYEAAR